MGAGRNPKVTTAANAAQKTPWRMTLPLIGRCPPRLLAVGLPSKHGRIRYRPGTALRSREKQADSSQQLTAASQAGRPQADRQGRPRGARSVYAGGYRVGGGMANVKPCRAAGAIRMEVRANAIAWSRRSKPVGAGLPATHAPGPVRRGWSRAGALLPGPRLRCVYSMRPITSLFSVAAGCNANAAPSPMPACAPGGVHVGQSTPPMEKQTGT